jgi:hypothetical protein
VHSRTSSPGRLSSHPPAPFRGSAGRTPTRIRTGRHRRRPERPTPRSCELARGNNAGAALRHLRDPAVRRPGRRGARTRSRRVTLERDVSLQRAIGQGLRLHRSRWQPTRLLEVRHRSSGRRETRGRNRLSLLEGLSEEGVRFVKVIAPESASTGETGLEGSWLIFE